MATEVYKGVTLNLPGNPQPNGLTEYNALKAIIDMADGALPATVKILSEYASLDAALTEFGTDEVSLIVDVDGAITTSTNLQNVDLALFLNGSEITGAWPLTINKMSAVPGYDPFNGPTVTYGADVESFAAKALTIRNNNNDATAVELNLDRFINSSESTEITDRVLTRVNHFGTNDLAKFLFARDDVRRDINNHIFREFRVKTEYLSEAYENEYAMPLRVTAQHDDVALITTGVEIRSGEGHVEIVGLDYAADEAGTEETLILSGETVHISNQRGIGPADILVKNGKVVIGGDYISDPDATSNLKTIDSAIVEGALSAKQRVAQIGGPEAELSVTSAGAQVGTVTNDKLEIKTNDTVRATIAANGAISAVLPDNNGFALAIDSADGKKYLLLGTQDGSEAITIAWDGVVKTSIGYTPGMPVAPVQLGENGTGVDTTVVAVANFKFPHVGGDSVSQVFRMGDNATHNANVTLVKIKAVTEQTFVSGDASTRDAKLVFQTAQNDTLGDALTLDSDKAARVAGNLHVGVMKSGATQAAAGAVAGEVWKTASHATLPDNVVMIGV